MGKSERMPDQAWVRRTLSAKLLEDAHLGSGTGGAGINDLVARDRAGQPVIWASHLEGLLRDAARMLPDRFDGVTVDRLFGTRGHIRQRAIFTSLYTNEMRASRVWRSTARVSFENRAPKDDTLRAIECVPKGTCFRGQVELPASDLSLIERLLREVDAVGHGRATGAGRISWTVTDEPSSPRPVGNPTSRMLLLLRNLDPLCVAATAIPSNIIPTSPFVPARTLIGALASWLLAETHQEVAGLLVDGRVSVSDALPVPELPDGTPLSRIEVLPAPLTLKSEKPEDMAGAVPWWARHAPASRRRDARAHRTGPKLKRPEADLLVYRIGDSAWSTHRPEIRMRLRNGRPDPSKQAEAPLLFAIEQIAERTCFLAEINGEEALLAKLSSALLPVLEGLRWLRIGRAGAPVEVAKVEWAETAKPSRARKTAYLTLSSDLLVRDERLRWLTSLGPADFSVLPGWPADLEVQPCDQGEAPVHGFNGTSRLWRLPAAAIKRGSVFYVKGDGVELLAKKAAAGQWLGERTHEGFGRFRVDAELPGVTPDAPTSVSVGLTEPVVPDLAEDATACETRIWLSQCKDLAKGSSSGSRCPSLSQWQQLVIDLETDVADAISSRKKPSTAGAAGWKHEDAQEILMKLDEIPSALNRAVHARLFVRWLRVEMRTEMRKGETP